MSSMLELPPVLAEAETAPAEQPSARRHLRLVPDVPLDFDSAVRRITPRLQRYASRRLGDVHEAEELVQEALLRAYKHGDALQTEDDLIAWCTVVTGRLVIDRLRVSARSINVAEVPEGTRVGRDTAEVVVARDEARTALDALDAMPARQAAVLWAREVEGQDYDEIGRRFGMTEPAVRSILTRARKSLRKEYALRGGTLPVGGLAALAPWISGLRWADRLRAVATRLAAPATIGAVALGLVGGTLHSPLFGGTTPDRSTSEAVVTSPAAQTSRAATAGAPAHQPTATADTADTRASPATPEVPGRLAPAPSLAERSPTTRACVRANHTGYAGGDSCLHGGTATRIWVDKSLPSNPTGVRYVGVEGTPVHCTDLHTNPVLSCRPSTHGASS